MQPTNPSASSHGGASNSANPAARHTTPGERRAMASDRRVSFDRRDMIRFEEDRRSGADRRANDRDPWNLGLRGG